MVLSIKHAGLVNALLKVKQTQAQISLNFLEPKHWPIKKEHTDNHTKVLEHKSAKTTSYKHKINFLLDIVKI